MSKGRSEVSVMVKVEALYRPGVVGVEAGDRLLDTAIRMQDNDVSAAVVYAGELVAGIVTERDLVRAVVDGADFTTTPASDYMTRDPVVVRLGDEARHAASLMLDAGVRHLPVVVKDEVVGMVSARDLLDLEVEAAV